MGAAIASLVVVTLFNFLKIALVYFKLKIHPFSLNSLWTLLLILGLYFIFKNIEIDVAPFYSILIKSLVAGVLYLALSYFLVLSEEVNEFINKFLKKQ